MKNRAYVYSTTILFTLALAALQPAYAATKSTDDSNSSSNDASNSADMKKMMKALEEQAARLNAQEKRLADQEKAIEDQKSSITKERIQFEKLQTQMISITGKPLPFATKSSKAAKNDDLKGHENKNGSSGTPAEVGTDRKQASHEKPPEVAAVIDQGGVLTQKGKIVFTPALEYSHSSNTSVAISGFSIIPAINIGVFDVSQVNRDILTPSVDFRYGLTNRLEIEGKVPYVWRKDSTLQRPVGVNAPDTLSSVNGNDIGDVEFAAHYQINNGTGGWPYLVGNLRFKTATGTSPFEVPVVNSIQTELPTGSGFYALQPSLTAIFPSDPVVYYGNIGYLHNFSRNYANYGTIDPGDGFSGSMGMSLSLNDKSSFSVGYSHTMVLKTFQNGAPLANSDVLQVGTLDLGYSYNVSEKTNVNFTVSAGVTADAPDIRLILRVPMTFDLF